MQEEGRNISIAAHDDKRIVNHARVVSQSWCCVRDGKTAFGSKFRDDDDVCKDHSYAVQISFFV